MTCQGAVLAETRDNPLVSSHPPLPVQTEAEPAHDHPAPRNNPYFTVPPVEGLVTLTGGELPEPTLLRPMSSKLTLQPVEREEPSPAAENRSSTIQLGRAQYNAFAHQHAAKASADQDAQPVASQASFDGSERLSETDGAITFSFSDASDEVAEPSRPTSPTAIDKAPAEELADVDDSRSQPQPAATKRRSAREMTAALEPGQVREASPVQLAPLVVEDEKNAPVVVSNQAAAAGKQKAERSAAHRPTSEAASSDDAMPVPTLLRPVEPILVANDSNRPTRREKIDDNGTADRVDEPQQTDSNSAPMDEMDQHAINGAPIVIERGAVAKIGTAGSTRVDESPVVTEGSLVVIDVPRDTLAAAPAGIAQYAPEADDVATPAGEATPDEASQPVDASALGSAAQPNQRSQPEAEPQPQQVVELAKDLRPQRAVAAAKPPRPEIEHVSAGSEEESSDARSASEEFAAVQPTAGEVTVAAAEVASLPFETPIHCFAVENSSICQVMAASANELRIIGQRKGKTRVAVWTGPRQSSQPLLYTLSVTAAAEQERQSLLTAANKLNLSLLQAFPGVDVRVTAGEGKLTVHGSAQGDEQARRILRLVRQACLVPVVDDIVVR